MNSSILKMRSLILTGVAIALPGMALAIDDIPDGGGFRAKIVAGVANTDMKSNFIAGNTIFDIGKETINDIDSKAESDDTTHAVVAGEVNYTFGNRWQAFLGQAPVDAMTIDGNTQLGIRKQFDNAGIVQVGLLAGAITQKVWEDPFQTGTKRNDTDRDANGIQLVWDKIFGSGAEVWLMARDIDVDKDNIGTNLGGDCDVACQNLLKRDADYTAVGASYLFKIGERQALRPGVRFIQEDTDGDAMNTDSYIVDLTYMYMGDRIDWSIGGEIGSTDYDKAIPILNQTYTGRKADSDRTAIKGTIKYKFSDEYSRWGFVGGFFYGEDDSDIDFFTTETFIVSLGVSYIWGER